MKQILRLFAAFFLICITGTLCGAFLFILYVQSIGYVAGTAVVPFSLTLLELGFLKSVPVALMLSPLFLILYEIRHPSKITGAASFFTIQVIVWLFLFPLSAKVFAVETSLAFSKNMVSTGYFRQYGNYLYYYSRIEPNQTRSYEVGSGLKYKLNELSVTQVKKPELIVKEGLRKTPSNFSDSLAEEILATPFLIKKIQNFLLIPMHVSKNLDTWLDYLIVVSMGFALMMLYTVKKMFSWKLVDTLVIIICSAGILAINSMYYTRSAFIVDFSSKVQGFLPFSIPLVFCVNLALFFILLVIGIIMLFKHKGE